MAKIGYARVSTHEQNLDLQLDALLKNGCEEFAIYKDTASGKNKDRPELGNCLKALREGDVLSVWRLDRLGRSLQDLITIVNDLEKRGIKFSSITESIDTSTPGGKMIFHVFGALAEFERNIIQERTLAGLKSARARGRVGGRKKILDAKTIAYGKSLIAGKTMAISDIAKELKISRSTLYRHFDIG